MPIRPVPLADGLLWQRRQVDDQRECEEARRQPARDPEAEEYDRQRKPQHAAEKAHQPVAGAFSRTGSTPPAFTARAASISRK